MTRMGAASRAHAGPLNGAGGENGFASSEQRMGGNLAVGFGRQNREAKHLRGGEAVVVGSSRQKKTKMKEAEQE